MAVFAVYIIECSDGSLYTGIANDIDKRLKEHSNGTGSKYVKSRLPIKGVHWCTHSVYTRSEASKLEAKIKKLSRQQKLKFCRDNIDKLNIFI